MGTSFQAWTSASFLPQQPSYDPALIPAISPTNDTSPGHDPASRRCLREELEVTRDNVVDSSELERKLDLNGGFQTRQYCRIRTTQKVEFKMMILKFYPLTIWVDLSGVRLRSENLCF